MITTTFALKISLTNFTKNFATKNNVVYVIRLT